MSKIKIAKCAAILFGMGIVICTFFIFLHIFAGKTADAGGKVWIEQKSVSEKAEIKGFQVNSGKVYLLVAEPTKESVIIFDETSHTETMEIVLKKEKINE